MKKLLLATAIASLSFGASAVEFTETIDFDSLKSTDSKTIDLFGYVPERCLLRVKNNSFKDVLKNARNVHDDIGGNAQNDPVALGDLLAWCNYGSKLKLEVKATKLVGIGSSNLFKTIDYDVLIGGQPLGNTKDFGIFKKSEVKFYNDAEHLKNKASKRSIAIQPEDAGFAKHGKYFGKMTVSLSAIGPHFGY
ncbi:hypothetical protein [Vibrio mytili]|uniref:Uncharacterized protein n=1 Tax=Vibrio mytili TaxID=50718 RepID=A0A0C3I7K1_9VIBR|nr:hypothetical protein [Vibrio mytili]KIN10287.1 hypothetical protein SU60_14440 [Vibrio mytili]